MTKHNHTKRPPNSNMIHCEGEGGGEGDEADDGPDDPYDLMDPVNILEKLPKDFYEAVRF